MALYCCRLFSRQLKPSLQLEHVIRYQHLASRQTLQQQNVTLQQQCSKSIKGHHPLSRKLTLPLQWVSRSFRSRTSKSVPTNQGSSSSSSNNVRGDSFSYFKSGAFVTGVCGCSFLGAMIWNYENVRQVYKDMAENENNNSHHRFVHEKIFGFRKHLNAIWTNMDQSTKLTLGIIAANIAVWILWKVPGFQPTMVRYLSSAAAHPRISMILSSFSHINLFHLVVNMYVLLSFAPVAAKTFGHEQFLAFYISAGTMSAFASIVCQKLLKRPLAISVGASGAIMGLLGVTGVVYPTAQLQVAFVSEIFPHSFSAETGIKAIILFDLLGLVLGWKVLDHAGHLGGMLFGILYAKYGTKYVWGQRDSIVRSWHEMRGKP